MKVVLEGLELHLAHPDELSVSWVGQDEPMRQLMAAWMVIADGDFPMNPRLLGKPGVERPQWPTQPADAWDARCTSIRRRSTPGQKTS